MTAKMRIWQRTLLGIAVLWALALPVLALVLPSYSGEIDQMSSDGTTVTTQTSATLVQVDGWQALITVSVPLVVSVLVAGLLSLPAGGTWTLGLAWTLTGLLAAGMVLALMSIGIFVLPVAGCLIAACAVGTSAIGNVQAPAIAPR